MDMNEMILPPGFRFTPTDGELIVDYLRNKVADKPLPVLHLINDRDLYNDDPPWIYGDPNCDLYFFTLLKNKSGKRKTRSAGGGTWRIQNTSDVFDGATLLGYKKTLNYIQAGDDGKLSKRVDANNSWIMHEYTLEGDGQTVALCRIRKGREEDKSGNKRSNVISTSVPLVVGLKKPIPTSRIPNVIHQKRRKHVSSRSNMIPDQDDKSANKKLRAISTPTPSGMGFETPIPTPQTLNVGELVQNQQRRNISSTSNVNPYQGDNTSKQLLGNTGNITESTWTATIPHQECNTQTMEQYTVPCQKPNMTEKLCFTAESITSGPITMPYQEQQLSFPTTGDNLLFQSRTAKELVSLSDQEAQSQPCTATDSTTTVHNSIMESYIMLLEQDDTLDGEGEEAKVQDLVFALNELISPCC